MSNWAWGSVSVTGVKENVVKFAQRFQYQGEDGVKIPIPYFSRSIAQATRDETIATIKEVFEEVPAEAESTFAMWVDFAWSAHDCLINGFPRDNNECCSLMDACQIDSVSVVIKAEELTGGTEEEIYCNKEGAYESHFDDMETYICTECGDSRCLPSYLNTNDYECVECGNIGYKHEDDEDYEYEDEEEF